MKLILLGAPGAGKGTLAECIVKGMGLKHISTGDIFRRNMKEGTPIGLVAKSHIDKGELVPDAVTIEIVKQALKNAGEDYMLDGFPRTTAQAEALDTFANIDIALNITVAFDVILERISGRRSCIDCGFTTHIKVMADGKCPKCGKNLTQRKDDKEEIIINRFEVYTKESAPLIDYYKSQNKFIEVDGIGTPDEVWQRARLLLTR